MSSSGASRPASGEQWLVRTSQNRIDGPLTREQLLAMIHDGKLGLQDEVCRANHYWIYLHEAREVRDQLGIDMPRASRSSGLHTEEEITETQTEAVEPATGFPTARESVARPARTVPSAPVATRGTPIEGSALWRGVAWLMAIGAGLLVVWVIRLLRGTA